MPKIAIVTDSTAYLSEEDKQRYTIYTVPLSISFGQETYREAVDIQTDVFYERMREEEELPTSSQPAIGEFISLYESLAETHDSIISIHLSGQISGTCQSAKSAGGMIEHATVYAVDSKITTYVQGQLVIQAAMMAEQGCSVDEILTTLERMIDRTNALFVVDDLTNLIKGGRISKFAGSMATFLKIKPVLTFEAGEIVPKEKIRTKKKAIAHIKRDFDEAVKQVDYPLQATIVHAQVDEEATELLTELQATYPEINFHMSYFGPVIGVHVGEGAIGITWTIDPNRE